MSFRYMLPRARASSEIPGRPAAARALIHSYLYSPGRGTKPDCSATQPIGAEPPSGVLGTPRHARRREAIGCWCPIKKWGGEEGRDGCDERA